MGIVQSEKPKLKAKCQYNNDYPSVTQVLDILRKIGLEMWFRMNTPQFIREKSEKAKTIGTQIHEAIQAHIEAREVNVQTEYAEEVMNALKGFMAYKKQYPNIKLFRSEMTFTSETHKFNGTTDAIGELDGIPILFDWKTGNAKDADTPIIYPEYVYQTSAYVKLYNEVENKNIDRAVVLVLAKDKVAFDTRTIFKEEINDSFNEVFLPALKIFNYQKRKGKE